MKSTLSTARNNTKNFARNLIAGSLLAETVASTDLVENLTTTITRPTANMLQSIENTSQALNQTLKNTSKWNLFHSIVNTATLIPRAVGSAAEWAIKTVWQSTQYLSGLNQIGNNNLITAGEWGNQTFSTSADHPDIAHKEIKLKDPTALWRDGTHWVLDQKEPPKSKFWRWLGNVKNSIFNLPLNIGRIGTDVVTNGARRIRWVVESVEWIGKGIKSAWSDVFTKWQWFWKKAGNIFSKWIRWSAKAIAQWAWNIINEWVFKTGASVLWIGTNFIGRIFWNTVTPLFSTKVWREQKDNIFEWQSRHNSFAWYYTSTPRKTDIVEKESKKEESDSKDEAKEENTSDSETKSEKKSFWSRIRPFGKKKKENAKATEKEANEKKEKDDKKSDTKDKKDETKKEQKESKTTLPKQLLGYLAGWVATAGAIKLAFDKKDRKALQQHTDKLLKDFETRKEEIQWKDLPADAKKHREMITSTLKHIGEGKYDLQSEVNKEDENKDTDEKDEDLSNKRKDKDKKEDNEKEWKTKSEENTKSSTKNQTEKEQSQKESNESMKDYILQEQRKFVKLQADHKEISHKDTKKWLESLEWYREAGGKIEFSKNHEGKVSAWPVESITMMDNNAVIQYKYNDTTEKETIAYKDIFWSDMGFHIADTEKKEDKENDKE